VNPIEKRKRDHIRICLDEDVVHSYNYWDDIQLVHSALPELDFSDIELGTTLFGKTLRAPVVISAITGGFSHAEKINRNIAQAAELLRIGMGVGSQRPALEHPELERTYSVIKEYDVPLVIANIGAPQLVAQRGMNRRPLTAEMARHAMEMIDADVLAVHMNFLQEVVQPEGDVNAAGCLDAIKAISRELPVVAKETGAGFSRNAAIALKKAGVTGFDAGGAGGTSFAAVEYYRATTPKHRNMGKLLWNWGIPTPVSVVNSNVGLPVIATGGIRNGLDIARAVNIGAASAGVAGRILKAATTSSDMVVSELKGIIEELRGVMFLCGVDSLSGLAKTKHIITGKTKDWLDA
jgi:isopentenyl-diphosphate delta-isomerase